MEDIRAESDVDIELNDQKVKDLKALWSDPAIQTAYRRGNEISLHDSIG